MKIEEALEIINNTNFYSCFTNEKQDEAFNMAVRALLLIQDHKKDIKMLDRMKGDHIAEVIANSFWYEIEKLEGSEKDNEIL